MKEMKSLFFLMFLLFLHTIHCEGECTCTGSNTLDCRTLKINKDDSQCLSCDDISKGESPYYSREYTIDNKPYCHKVGKSGYAGALLISGTKQLAKTCKELGLFKLGDLCYGECPANSNKDEANFSCTCKEKFYTTIEDGFKVITCIPENDPCEEGYNYINPLTNECLKACPNGMPYLKKYKEDNNKDYVCQERCNSKTIHKKSHLGKKNIYCLDECPDYAKFYYDDNICLEKCSRSEKDYYDMNNKCIEVAKKKSTDCGGSSPSSYYFKISPEENIFLCVSESFTSCPAEFPYKFIHNGQTYCLKSCDNTNIPFFGGKKSYLRDEDGLNICFDMSNFQNSELYKIEREKRVISDCFKDPYWPFHIGKECVPNCGTDYIDNETNECLNGCGNKFTDEETKTCFAKCPDYLGRGFYDDDKKCVACGISGDGSGFHKEKEYNDNKCYPSCPDNLKHNKDNNICFEGCKYNNKYTYDTDPKICFSSCSDIEGDYTIEKEYKCYKENEISSEDFNDYYFYQVGSIKKYVKKKECLKNGLKYLKGKECVDTCDTDYKANPTNDEFGMCYENQQNCIDNNYIFIDENKICSKECDYYTINDNTGQNYVNEANCFSECPDGYYLVGKICKQNCENCCYIERFGIKKYFSKNDYYQKDSDTNECVDYCSTGNDVKGIPIFSYYDSNKICLSECSDYYYKPINKNQECLTSCQNDYYYQSNNICLKKCDKYYQSKDSKICVDNCNNDQYIHPGNICSNDSCPKDAPFYKVKDEERNIIECLSSCDKFISETKECVSTSDLSIELYGGLISECPTGYVTNENKCDKPAEVGTNNCNFFSIQTEESGYICKETCDQNQYVTAINECVGKCPIGLRFVTNGKYCVNECENAYKKIIDNSNDYTTYECISSCSSANLKQIYGTKECVSSCDDLYEYANICYTDCNIDGTQKYKAFENGKLVCKDSCDWYNDDETMCIEECLDISKKIKDDGTKKCVDKCNTESNYKFLKIIDNELHCSNGCNDPKYKRYLLSDYKCISKCPATYCANESTGECILLESYDKKYYLKDDEYICTDDCTQEFPYTNQGSKLCISKCELGHKIIDGNICIENCGSDKYFYEYDENLNDNSYDKNTCVNKCEDTNKPFLRENGFCDTQCDNNPNGDYYYLEGTFNCLKIADCNGKKIDGRICRVKCDSENSNNKYLESQGGTNCLHDCELSNSNRYNNAFTCQSDYKNYFLEKNNLETQCTTGNNFYDGEQCVMECPKGKNFLISDKNCLNDCNEGNQFYSKNEILSKTMLKCEANCNSYADIHREKDPNKKAKLCLGEKCNSFYPFYTTDGSSKECLEKCSEGYDYYYKTDSGEFRCVELADISNMDNYIIYGNTNKLVKKSECNYINKSTNTCVEKCSENQVIYNKRNAADEPYTKYCAANCQVFGEEGQEGPYLDLSGQQCVDSCGTYEEAKLKDNNVKQCDCKNLYYIDITSGIKVCIDDREINCTKQIEYPYLIYGTKECNNSCEGTLSLNGFDCYINEDYECPVYSRKNEHNQCVCNEKFYHYDTDTSKEIYCMPPNSTCPRNESLNRELLVEGTTECVEYCPFKKSMKKYGKTCVDLCPIMSVVVNDECFCEDKWYMNDKDEMICVSQCPKENPKKPIMIVQTKQCVETCKNTEYPVFYRNNCYLDCNDLTNTEKIYVNDDEHYDGYKLEESYGEYGEQICLCKGVWYEDGNNGGCYTGDNCTVLNDIYDYNYMVLPTKQCVSSCPDLFPYSFNDRCFESCEKANTLLDGYSNNETALKKLEKDGESNICKCSNLWRYKEDDLSKIECLEETECGTGYLLIVGTNECYKSSQCRQEYPLLFNKKCYNENSCPENTEYKEEYPNTCSCVKYYYIDDDTGNIRCHAETEECSGDYRNLIYSKNQCVKDGDDGLNGLVKYNGIYYKNCPYASKKNQDNICICDILYGFWLENAEGKKECGLKECPEAKPNYYEVTKECLSEPPDGKFQYNKIYYDDCPPLTSSNENNICELQPSIDKDNITKVTEEIKSNIVNLYKGSNKEESNVIDLPKIDTTVEFYGVSKNKNENKNKDKHNKDKKSSSLSYIDLTDCIQKIYESNPIDYGADIIILKYDLKTPPSEYLISPVEYKFINSKNGHELDATACGKSSIKISYPFTKIISQLDLLSKKKRNLVPAKIEITTDNDLNSLMEKYNVGKTINGEYTEIDTFNSKDSIYTDFCTSVEINGKDLVLEDRMNYLLPHYSLCEQNCTYNHTDFEEERIYCDCPFKTEFDLNREHQNTVELNENAVTQSQDGTTNFPVLKCISVLGDSKRIKGNIAFYYMLLIIIIEIGFLILTILFGYKSFKFYLNDKVIDNDITENNIEITVNNNKEKNYDEIIKTTQRELNNPPIRNNNNNNDEEEEQKEERNGIEFIPEEFVFLYFNDNDKGIKKQVEKSELPFDIKENTKILLQKIENYDYTNLNADGPFPEEQNIIEILFKEEEKVKINIESINETITENDIINEKNDIKNKMNEKEIIPITEEKIYRRDSLKNYMINEFDEIEEDKENKGNKSLLDELKLEQRLLTKDYKFYNKKTDTKLFTIILTEILDKIYLAKNILFIRKYDIMYLNLSVYVLYHAILLTLLAMFYNINTIKNIWNNDNYPGMGLYLGYGILTAIITWVIYILIGCLLTNKGKYNEIIIIRKSKKRQKENKAKLINKKGNSLISKMKIKMIVYYIIQFILLVFFFIYLVTLCAVYSGTMKKIFASYGIALLEIIIIKIIYGLILGILRSYSISNQKSGLYKIISFFDKYVV